MKKKLWLGRLLWAAAFLGSAVLIGFRGGAGAFLLFWSLCLMPVFSLLFLHFVRLGVVIQLSVDDGNAVHGETLPVGLKFVNETRLPLPRISVRMTDGKVSFPEEQMAFSFSLKPGEERVFSLDAVCRHVGADRAGAEIIYIPDWFGLAAAKYKRTEIVYILPRKQRMDSVPILPESDREKQPSNRSYVGERVPDGQWRLYQPGDDLRRVNWKLSARTGSLLMKNLVPEPKDEIILIPDGRDTLPEGRAAWMVEDNMIEGTLALADFFLRSGMALTVVPDLERKITLSESSVYDSLYKMMARGFFSGKASPDETLVQYEQISPGSRYILMTFEIDEAMIRTISGVLSHGARVALIFLGDAPEAARLASSEDKIDFYQVTSETDIFRTLGGRS